MVDNLLQQLLVAVWFHLLRVNFFVFLIYNQTTRRLHQTGVFHFYHLI
jgi:hypothetical protein